MSATSSRLYDLWLANGKPEAIGYAASGGYVDAGARQVATGLTSCAGGALGLREVNGRLMGRWCGGSASGTPATAGYTIPGKPYVPGYKVLNPPSWGRYTEGPPGVLHGNYLRIGGGLSGGLPAGTYWINDFAGKHELVTYTEIPPIPAVPEKTVPPTPAMPATLNAAVAAVAEINLAPLCVPWITAKVWSKAGEWVRKKSWADTLMMIRHEAGPGSTRAVAVLKSSTVTAPRAVRNSEFGVAEFLGLDWVMVYPSSGDLDLTDAVIAVDAAQWVLWKRAAPTPTDPTNPTDPTTPTLPKTGEGFLYLKNGVTTLVLANDEMGNPWAP